MDELQELLQNETEEYVLENELQNLMEQNDLLIKENDILTAHLFRRKQEIIQHEKDMGNDIEDEEDFARDLFDMSDYHAHRGLTQAEKTEAITAEEEAIKEDLNQIQEHAQKDVQALKEVLEEAQLRANEIKKDAYEFRRDIVIGAENMQTGQIKAEKVIRHLEDKLKNKVKSITPIHIF